MSSACQEFRARLAQALDASAPLARAPALEWHTHVLTCAECRALLESEQALEHVLASLPQPTLPPHLARRVLERLAEQRVEAALDRTLDLALDLTLGERASEDFAAPSQLASNLLARLGPARARAERERRLEHALDALLASAPPPNVPAGLSVRVLKGLAAARRSAPTPTPRALRAVAPAASTTSTQTRELQPAARSWAWLAAAGVALFAGAAAWFLSRSGAGDARRDDVAIELNDSPKVRRAELIPNRTAPEHVTQAQSGSGRAPERGASELAPALEPTFEPDLELLAQLELLESWELLADEALELELLGVDEFTLLSLQELEFDSSADDEDSVPAPGSTPKNDQKNTQKNIPRNG